MSFLDSIQNQSKKHEFPFNHWEYNNALTDGAIEEIIKADIPDVSKHNIDYDGTRAIDGGAAEFREGIASGGEAIKFRCFVNKENRNKFPTPQSLNDSLFNKMEQRFGTNRASTGNRTFFFSKLLGFFKTINNSGIYKTDAFTNS